MTNRSSFSDIPVIFTYTKPQEPVYPALENGPSPLQVYDITFLHFHNLMEIALCISGEGICYVDEKTYPFKAGDIQIIFPYQRHLSKSTSRQPSQWYWLNVDIADSLLKAGFSKIGELNQILSEEMGLYGIIDKQRYPGIHELGRSMIEEVFLPRQDRVHRQEYYSACLFMLIQELRQTSVSLPKIHTLHKKELQEIGPALLEIKNSISTEILPAVADMAGICDMSIASFRRKFNTAMGISPKNYITGCCIYQACKLLLTTDDKMVEISSKCGFDNISGFNRCFLKTMGCAPSEYRRRNKLSNSFSQLI